MSPSIRKCSSGPAKLSCAETAPVTSVPNAAPSGFKRGNSAASAPVSSFDAGRNRALPERLTAAPVTASRSRVKISASRSIAPAMVASPPSNASAAATPVLSSFAEPATVAVKPAAPLRSALASISTEPASGWPAKPENGRRSAIVRPARPSIAPVSVIRPEPARLMPAPSAESRVRSTARPSRAAVASRDQAMSRPSSGGTATPSGATSPRMRPCAARPMRVSGLSRAPAELARTLASTWSAPKEAMRVPSLDKFSSSDGRLSVPVTDAVRTAEPPSGWPSKPESTESSGRLARKSAATASCGPPIAKWPVKTPAVISTDSGSTTIPSPNFVRIESATWSPISGATSDGSNGANPAVPDIPRTVSSAAASTRSAAKWADVPAEAFKRPCQSASGPLPFSESDSGKRSTRPSSRSSTTPVGSVASSWRLSTGVCPAISIANRIFPAELSMRCRSSAICALPPAKVALPSTVARMFSPNTGGASASLPIDSRSSSTGIGRCGTLR